jgi:hypothetical protein
MMMYEFCEDCHLPHNPLKTRGAAKQIMWSKEPDPIAWMKNTASTTLWLTGTDKGLKKMAACQRWPKDLKDGYEKKSVDGKCPTGKGACNHPPTSAIEEFDVNGKALERPGTWTCVCRGCVGILYNWLPST